MSRTLTLPERNNAECPRCGSILTRCRGGGRSDSDHRLRRRVCQDCALIFTTVEVPVLYADGSPVPLSALDGDFRAANRRRQRERVGYHATPAGRRPIRRSAQLRVTVAVTPPRLDESAGPWDAEDAA